LSPDLFVILVPATPSLIPSNPLSIIPNLKAGLGVHQISSGQASTDRLVTSASPQHAISITENLNTNDTIWGASLFQGTPNNAGVATVFTQRIANKITATYQGAGLSVPAGVIEGCIKHTTAHEAGHNMAIASQYNAKLGGNHYSTSSQVVMSQTATITVKGSNVTVICPQTYATPDPTDFKLVP